jgi:FMN-dependent NADH-azoreductase
MPAPEGRNHAYPEHCDLTRKEQSASRALVEAFLREYTARAENIAVDTLDIWQERLPEFDAETINAKYKGVSGEP